MESEGKKGVHLSNGISTFLNLRSRKSSWYSQQHPGNKLPSVITDTVSPWSFADTVSYTERKSVQSGQKMLPDRIALSTCFT